MRILIVEPGDRAGQETLLRQAYALRHRVFVDERRWEMLRQPDRLDIDHHDRGATVHILAVVGDVVVGYARLVPGGCMHTTKPDPAMVRDAAAGYRVYGLGRFCVDSKWRDRATCGVLASRLFIAVVKYAAQNDMRALLFETDAFRTFILRILGFPVITVGAPAVVADQELHPVLMRLEPGVLTGLESKIANWHRRDAAPAIAAG